MQTQQSKTPRLFAGVIVAVVVAAAMMVTVKPSTAVDQARAAAPAGLSEDRPIPASPWAGEAAGVAHDDSGLGFASDATIQQGVTDMEAATMDQEGPRAGDAMRTMRIDGSSLDTMVDSINAITASLPEDDARAFQKAVRILMVASLPIEQLRARKVSVDKVPPEQLIAGAQKILAGRTPLEVLKIAQARINVELQRRAQGYGPGDAHPASELQLTR